jgi:hypothetical protein
MVMFAEPMSPLVENLTPSLVTEIRTVSPMLDRSLPPRRRSLSQRAARPLSARRAARARPARGRAAARGCSSQAGCYQASGQGQQ